MPFKETSSLSYRAQRLLTMIREPDTPVPYGDSFSTRFAYGRDIQTDEGWFSPLGVYAIGIKSVNELLDAKLIETRRLTFGRLQIRPLVDAFVDDFGDLWVA